MVRLPHGFRAPRALVACCLGVQALAFRLSFRLAAARLPLTHSILFNTCRPPLGSASLFSESIVNFLKARLTSWAQLTISLCNMDDVLGNPVFSYANCTSNPSAARGEVCVFGLSASWARLTHRTVLQAGAIDLHPQGQRLICRAVMTYGRATFHVPCCSERYICPAQRRSSVAMGIKGSGASMVLFPRG